MHECGKDFNEVFLYGGGHFLVPLLLREFHQVQKLDAELANTVGLGIWVLPSCVFAGIVAFALSRRLLKASGTSHGCCLQSIHGLALLCVAVAIFFQLSIVTCIGIVTWVAQQFLDGQNVTTAAVTPHVDYTLRFAQKIDFCIGAANGLHDNASVTLQHCHTGGLQQFILQTDGTIRSKRRDDLCVTKVADSSQWQLQTCSTNSSDRQIFNAAAQSHGWLELQAMPDMCMSLLAKGALGVQACSRDVNEVFVYSGGNAGIAELALHLNDAVQALTKALQVLDGFPVAVKALTKALQVSDSFPIVAMQPAARAQGAAWALLVAVPSILLLLGRLPAPKLDDEDLMLTL
jgi:F0F1-type ATP synthase assembly protein I